jgi:hypothetical protein
MMHPIKTQRWLLGVSALFGIAAFGAARSAEAYPTYPPRLQAGLKQYFPTRHFCVPQCIVCHTTNAGGDAPTAFANNLIKYRGTAKIGFTQDDPIVDVVKNYFDAVAANATTGGVPSGDSDGDGTLDVDELEAGDLPGVEGLPGKNLLCADIKYGCGGGRIAAAPPPLDNVALASAGLALVGFAAMRRRVRRAKR